MERSNPITYLFAILVLVLSVAWILDGRSVGTGDIFSLSIVEHMAVKSDGQYCYTKKNGNAFCVIYKGKQ